MDGAPESRTASGIALHLAPEVIWRAASTRDEYRPESFAAEGFAHCTHGETVLLEVANRYYRDDPRPYVVLDVDLSLLSAPAIYEDDSHQYPHVYAPIDRHAVRRVRQIQRAPDGTFTAIGAAMADPEP
jgi:uncharacterized protein (DUF952 family)